jgi:hypothetical protein
MTQRAVGDSTRVCEEWSTERGTTTIVEKSNTVVLVSSKGHLDSQDGKRMGSLIDELLVLRPRHLFFDMGELASYHPDVRRDLTQLFLGQKQRVLSLHVLARSKLVRMGVSVARLALDALVGHSDASSFNRALNQALRDV